MSVQHIYQVEHADKYQEDESDIIDGGQPQMQRCGLITPLWCPAVTSSCLHSLYMLQQAR